MPRYFVSWVDEEGKDGGEFIVAKDKHAAADKAMDEYGADEVLEVEEQ
jgi:hypothetical protein